jgi:hypothetical protein
VKKTASSTETTSKFTIKADELAKGLGITIVKLYNIVEFFDSDDKDEWDLKENEHFIWLAKGHKTRIFSQEGAYAIATYLDQKEKKSFFSRFKEFIFRHQEKLRQSFVRQKVLDNSKSLMCRGGYSYLSRKDTVAILSTSYARLSQAFKDVQKTDTLVYDQDFIEIDDVNYYSLHAFEALSRNLGDNLKSTNRCAWCKEVSSTGFKTLHLLVIDRGKLQQRIAAAKKLTRSRDRDTCQITGKKSKPANPINMAVHHIYCESAYPDVADSMDNLITLTEDVHKEFHTWHGGNKKPCTIHDLIRFTSVRYPEREVESIRLDNLKKKFAYLDADSN